jgi:methyl-accepting chemotaxis protein
MRWFSNIKLAYRLGFGFAMLLVMMAALTALGLNSMGAIQGRLDDVVKTDIYKLRLLTIMAESVHIVSRVTRTLVLIDDDPSAMEHEYQKIVDARARYDQAWGELQKIPAGEKAQKIRAQTEEARQLGHQLNEQVIALARARKTQEATSVLLKQAGPATTKWQEALHSNIELQHENADRDLASAHAAYATARQWMYALLATGMVFGSFVSWFITRSITHAITKAVHITQAVARGDLSQNIEVDSQDETGQLLQGLKDMTGSLATTVRQVRTGAEQVSHAASQLSASAAQVTQATHRQSEAAAGVASAVEQVTVSITSVAHNADDVRELAKSSQDKTEQGNSDMHQLVGEIGSVESAVKQIQHSVSEFMTSVQAITEMAKQVKDLADQTNLLALNAAIEAARAGEQGRGFAVVADEVRKLSERSAESASQIDTITQTLGKQSTAVEKAIGEGMESLGSSRERVDAVVTVLSEAKNAVASATKGVEDIAGSVREQTTATTDIAKHVEKIAQMAEENHVSVNETDRAARSLEQLASELQSAVTKFQLASGR